MCDGYSQDREEVAFGERPFRTLKMVSGSEDGRKQLAGSLGISAEERRWAPGFRDAEDEQKLKHKAIPIPIPIVVDALDGGSAAKICPSAESITEI